MDIDRARQMLNHLARAGREEILRIHSQDSCIESSRIMTMVLNQLKIQSYPLVVFVDIYNPQIVEWLKTHKLHELEAREAIDAFGGWIIGLGKTGEPVPNKWDGHLAIIADLADHSWLIDVSIDQCNRPQKNIVLQPLVAPVAQEFLRGEEGCGLESSGGVYAIYKAYPEDQSFKQAGGWFKHMQQKKQVVDNILFRMRRYI